MIHHSPFFGMLRTEMRSQWQSGLSALYLGMPLLWIIAARLLPSEVRPLIALIGVYSDPVMMGQIFIGAFLMRERDQGLLEAWAASPLGAGTWLWVRVFLIGIQSTVGGFILAAGAGVPVNFIILLPTLFFASMSAALIGIIIARPFRDILSYFAIGGIGAALVNLPIAGIFLQPGKLWFFLGPAASGWAGLYTALGFQPGEVSPSITTMLITLVIWTLILFMTARQIYNRGFFRRHGKGSPILKKGAQA